MRYHDIEPANTRFRMPESHQILAEITIDPADWHNFERLNDDTPATRILGRDVPHDGLLTIYVACASDEVRKRLEDGWA